MRWSTMISQKMRSPAFPPRRPSAVLRYILPAAVLLTLFYYLSPPRAPAQLVSPTYVAPSIPIQNLPPGQVNQQSPAGKTGEIASDHNAKEQHEINQPRPIIPQEPIVGSTPNQPATGGKGADATNTKDVHPIDRLIDMADKQFADTLSQQSHTLNDAAAAYRKRRGRHPPPGFDQWYAFAQERNAVIVESFWDQIYHDLEPFWALRAEELRKAAWEYEMTINVRGGTASAQSDWFWTQIWLGMIQTISHMLPDMDIALNAMDEPRLVVPWEEMNEYMNKASAARGMVPAKDAINEFERLAKPGQGRDRNVKLPAKNWEGTSKFTNPQQQEDDAAWRSLLILCLVEPYWKVAMRGCAPDSPTRKADVMTNWDHPPTFSPSSAEPHMYRGFVSNYTMSTEICHQPDLQGLNGMFIEPLTVSATKTLFPMFGGSKLSINNEILLPAPMYWSEEERFTAGGDKGVDWSQKVDAVVWRGVATGGRNRENNWRAFQRHRFVAMNNGTKIARAEEGNELTANFELPAQAYELAAQKPLSGKGGKTNLGKWVDSWADVAFVDLMCLDEEAGGQCHYTSPYFSVEEGIKLADQFNWKYLPDIDGNSFSGRYLGFLRSTSLPIKATVYREWHDSRLIAWKHFVPMDNRYGDWFGIMEYFLGHGSDKPAHDAEAEKIASAGKEWADRVLRREDMQIYVLRLLLEYARVSDERREKMGWVQDLLDNFSSGGSKVAK